MSNGHVTYAQIQEYLELIAKKANFSVDSSPHGRFWKVSYKDFVAGFVPDNNEDDSIMKCEGQPVPIIDTKNPEATPFYNILRGTWCKIDQMPDGGPFITGKDNDGNEYTITLGNGTTVTGQKIQDDILSWLKNGFPET